MSWSRNRVSAVVILSIASCGGVAVGDIEEIVEAGVVCSGTAPDVLGKNFYNMAQEKCKNQMECNIDVTQIESEDHLTSWGCTHTFAIISCGNDNYQEYQTTEISENLYLFCDGPQ